MLLSLLITLFSFFSDPQTYKIPIEGNAWSHENDASKLKEIDIYFNNASKGQIFLELETKSNTDGELVAELNGVKRKVKVTKNSNLVSLGTFSLKKIGYQKLTIKYDRKLDINLNNLIAKAPFEIIYAKDEFYWSRRGPSVHFSYTMPENKDVRYLYNELTVPIGNDVIGSYFMSNGFAEGYFGIQVNSETERRILFSVWSPFTTDNPKDIPDDQKILLLKKGENVKIGEFGNEGSGGQSYKVFNWKAGNTYKFLTKIEPSIVEGSSDYTAYFFAPETQKWELIASFRRPKTTTYAKRFHSFLENFIPSQGDKTREVHFGNQWVVDTDNNWYELSEAKFTADATARKKNRLDYAGGVKKNKFVLENCGFFSHSTVIGSIFERVKENKQPSISFDSLP